MLHVTTDLPFGNGCAFQVDAEGELPVIRFTADPHGGPESMWFCFRIVTDGVLPRMVRLEWVNMENSLGASQPDKVHPVMRPAGEMWRRLEAGECLRSEDGRGAGSWTVELTQRETDVALCFPYGPEDEQQVVTDGNGYWKADTIGVTQGGRPMVRLVNDYSQPGDERPGLFLVSRQHSGEVGGSWVLDGMLRWFAERQERRVVVWSVPLLNLDGVMQGDYGKDNFPYDLNRSWGSPPMRHEALVVQRDMRRWCERCRPAYALDSHCPGLSETAGVYGFLPACCTASVAWAKELGEGLGEDWSAPAFMVYATYASRWETPTFIKYCKDLGIPGLSMETPYSRIRDRVLEIDDYREIGRRLAQTIIAKLT